MGTYRQPKKHQCFNKPSDYTAIGNKTGGNFGLIQRELNLTVSINIGHYMRFFNFFVKDDERNGAI